MKPNPSLGAIDHEGLEPSHPTTCQVHESKIGLLGLIALLIAGWHWTFSEMWLRWYPAWPNANRSLVDRLTQGESYYSHGPLVPLVSLILAWAILKRVGFPRCRSRGASRVGGLVLLMSVTLHLLSVSPSAGVMFASGFSLVGVLGALVLLWGGWPAARAYGLPILFLLFMVPLPELAIVDINFRLKIIASQWAVWLTHHVMGIPALLDGSYIYLPPNSFGQPKVLVVENVCSGLRSLIALVWIATLFAMVCRLRGIWRWMMVVVAIPVALICNVVRITVMSCAAHYISLDVAKPGGWIHDVSGLMVFATALALLLGLEKIVIVASRLFSRSWVDDRLLGFLDRLPKHTVGLGHPRPLVLLVLIFTAAMSVYWSACVAYGQTSKLNTDAIPNTITLEGVRYVGVDHELDAKSLLILEHPEYLFRTYTDSDSGRSLDLLIVSSANNRKGTHPPEVCIEGGGQIMVDTKMHVLSLPSAGDLSLRELLTQRASTMSCYLYTYKYGNRFTPSFLTQQFWIFINSLTAGNTSGALIRLSVSGEPATIEASRGLALAAAKKLLPDIDSGL